MKNENFFDLFRYSKQLRREKKHLSKEDPVLERKLVKSLATIEVNYQHLQKEKYVELVKDFLNSQITVEEFCNNFIGLFCYINREFGQMLGQESPYLLELLEKDKEVKFAECLYQTYACCDNLSFDVTPEELKNWVEKLLVELEK